MPNKKIIRRVPHLTTTEEKELAKLLDIETSDEIIEEPIPEINEEDIITTLHLSPAGYPIKPLDAPERSEVTVNKDLRLFQAYASEQWAGLTVKLDDFIFDQLLIPDFAFKIQKIIPAHANKITSETNFVILKKDRPQLRFQKIAFNEIIGNDQAKNKADIIVEYLKNPDKFGEWAPKNILFHGPPGTGKTLTAKAIASAADCAFIAKKGTTLIGLHVGDGASKIHGLFEEARNLKPSIIFIDELDSIGLNRSYQSVRGDVIEVATALLAELDGLDPSDGVITIAATNGIELLDIGLRNRFEEEIEFPLPKEEERIEMLELFCQKLPQKYEIDFAQIARLTEGWSGRALHEKLVKIVVHQAFREKKKIVTTAMLKSIIESVNKQSSRKNAPSEFFA
ncbi:ATP-dependent zinc metalloprotease FtsH [Candidatus Lokiarchaeum ossiferum]|uniref:ATP-dependent zinc metalloprotease FtsH n=1 Tax=Candidatus Lokiarchaeum ossiferum TaxID=2951803 RepID=A0ABY6HZX0_9ARCH|nr:ATP-dependent zinc metalloprotease FtsH [Candidatus Lokiarchaeum sp. B-35]